jgi:hypothetical protein
VWLPAFGADRAADDISKETPMTIRKLDKSEWTKFFNAMSRPLENRQAEIEVASLAVGDQVEADWLPLIGITYDPKDDILEVALEGVDHMIQKPREIHVDDTGVELHSVEIVDGDGDRQIVKLREPLMLPA